MTEQQYRVTVDANGNMDGWVRRALVQHLPVTPDRIKMEPISTAVPTADEPSEQFTPSTAQVRAHYVFDQSDRWDSERGAAFDRWLASVSSPHPPTREQIEHEVDGAISKWWDEGALLSTLRPAVLNVVLALIQNGAER